MELFIQIVSLIVFGLIVGRLAGLLVGNMHQNVLRDSFFGIVGSVVGGVLAKIFFGEGIVGFSIPSLAVGIIGSLLVLSLVNMFFDTSHFSSQA